MPDDFRSLSDTELTQKVERVKTSAGFGLTGGIFGRRGSRLIAEYNRRGAEARGHAIDLLSGQVEQMRAAAITPEDRAMVSSFATRAEYMRISGDASGVPKWLEMSGAWLQGQEDQRLGNEAALSEADNQRLAESDALNNELRGKLEPYTGLVDDYQTLVDISDVDNPAAVAALRYRWIRAVQQDPRISDKDAATLSRNIGSGFDYLDQVLASGVEGAGLLPEARANVLNAVQPLLKSAQRQAQLVIGEHVDVGMTRGMDMNRVLAGVDAGRYREPVQPVIAEPGEPFDRSAAASKLGGGVSEFIRDFLGGYTGVGPLMQGLDDLEAGKVELTPEAESRLAEIGGIEAIRELSESIPIDSIDLSGADLRDVRDRIARAEGDVRVNPRTGEITVNGEQFSLSVTQRAKVRSRARR